MRPAEGHTVIPDPPSDSPPHSSGGALPLIGREELLAGIEDVLRGDSFCGAYVSGSTGTGKSVLARTLIEDLQEEFASFHLTPAASLATIPYGALAPLLAEATSSDLASPRTVLRAALSFLRRHAQGRPVLVVVDDAHLLDDSSGYVLAQLAVSRALRLAAFARPGTAISDELVSLSQSNLLQGFDIAPLTSEDALELCSRTLGGPVVRGASERLRNAASGNPLLLIALLGEARATGSLTEHDGVWMLAEHELPVPRALVDFLRAISLAFDEHERRAFELLALGEALPFQDLVELTSEEAVATLLRDGLLRRVPHYPVFATLTNALFGRIARLLVPVGRSTALLEAVERRAGALHCPPQAEIRRALWNLECGRPIPDDRLLALAETALSLRDPDSALRLLTATTAPTSAVARVRHATAILYLGRLPESRDAGAGILEEAQDPDVIAAAGMLEVRQLQTAGEGVSAIEEVTDRWARALSAQTGNDDGASALRASEQRRIAVRALAWSSAGRYMDAVESLEPLLVRGTDRTAGLLARAGLIEALGALGRSSDAAGHGEAAAAQLRDARHQQAYPSREVTLRLAGMLVQSGQFRAAHQVIEAYAADGTPDYAFLSGSLAALQGISDVRAGRFSPGLGALRPAVAALRRADPDGLLPYALGAAAWAAAARGDAELLDSSAEELADLSAEDGTSSLLLGRAFAAAAQVLLGTVGGSSSLLDLAAEARGHGWIACEKDILGLAMILGNRQAAGLLLQITGTMQGAEATILTSGVSALMAGDAGALAAAGDRAEAFELFVLATDACRRAMELYAAARDIRSQRLLAPVFRRRRMLIDGALFAEPGEEPGGSPLTLREREIAVLTLRGRSNREIAQELTVSVRTVEGHLYRIFVKLGITRREDLTAELEPSLLAM